MTRIKRIAMAVLLGALLLVAAPNAAQAAKPSFGCPAGFNLGALNVEQILRLPRSQAAIRDGVVTEAGIRSAVAGVDKNGTGRICVSLSHGLVTNSRPGGQYFYNLVDDNSSVR